MEINFVCDYGPSKGLVSELPEENIDFTSVICPLSHKRFVTPSWKKNNRASSLNVMLHNNRLFPVKTNNGKPNCQNLFAEFQLAD
jgi:hypothetical protein